MSKDIEEKGTKALLAERRRTHGDFLHTAGCAQSLKRSLRLCSSHTRTLGYDSHWDSLPPAVREALEMIAVKQARIISGDWREQDHWRDIAGYAEAVLELLNDPRGRLG